MSPAKNVPVNAVFLTWFIACLLALIPLGSTVAFLNIQTIGNAGLLLSYWICIATRLYNRLTVGPYAHLAKPPKFFLGKMLGNVVNVLALLFLTCFFVSGMFPPAPNPDASTMNWASMALGSVLLIAGVSYIRLHKTYLGAGVGANMMEMDDVNHGSKVDYDSKGFNTTDRRL